ncbi:MAG: porin [Longimicrobiales bacterium]
MPRVDRLGCPAARRAARVWLAVLLLLQVVTPLRAQDAPTVEVELGGYAQFQYQTTSVDLPDDVASSSLETRRVRLAVGLTIDDWITATIEPDYALGELDLADVWVDLAFSPAFRIKVGQYKKPFSLVELSSSTRLIPIERGVRIAGLASELDASGLFETLGSELLLPEEYALLDGLGYSGRDLGVQAHGEIGRLGYAVGVFNGEGQDRADLHEGKSASGRLSFAPSGELPLRLGGAVGYRETFDDDPVRGVAGVAFELDAEWGEFRRPGLHAVAEVAAGENLGAVEDDFRGAQAQAGWFLERGGDHLEGVDIHGRASWGDPRADVDEDEAWLLTPGMALYFYGRNRVLLDWDLFLPAADALETRNALRAQIQVHF